MTEFPKLEVGAKAPDFTLLNEDAKPVSLSDYAGKKVILTPLPENTSEAIDRVADAWRHCGAIIHRLTAEEHDAVFAAVSHLPHLLAYALVDDIAARGNASLLFQYAASGFRDLGPSYWILPISGKNDMGRLPVSGGLVVSSNKDPTMPDPPTLPEITRYSFGPTEGPFFQEAESVEQKTFGRNRL